MKHIIEGKEVNIDWEIGETIDNHGSGCKDVQLSGEGDDRNMYFASGNSQDDELVEVYEDDIEVLKKDNIVDVFETLASYFKP
ncbi:hypothetical protein [Mucilaginibacter sp. 10I4]|uniref:hypothetical protein n=1 Tax=Mucilaginibacter sp. 10I4 TaxID=3048580 RepID=UPI002B22AB04|nr:hypothetical protein [Mucilaginibacter sp. 10I4]MEB0262905.1 hypothetical protein [Mucilaginibacter sp. 10I4]